MSKKMIKVYKVLNHDLDLYKSIISTRIYVNYLYLCEFGMKYFLKH